MTNEPLIPVLIAFEEGEVLKRARITAKDFARWRNEKNIFFPTRINLHCWFGVISKSTAIIVTMNGFVYDKVYENETGSLLRERMAFNFDINKLRIF